MFKDNSSLLRYIPNVIKNVTGEPTFLEKLTPFLTQAELWLSDYFTSADTLKSIKSYKDSNPLLHHCRMAVMAHAMLLAIPHLDLIITPNGFGVVSNQNIAPASKERVERLLNSLEKLRDDALTVLLPLLTDAAKWDRSSQRHYFEATLYPHLDVVHMLGYSDHIWQRYQQIRSQLLLIEQHLELEFFSEELMNKLRYTNLFHEWTNTKDPSAYEQVYRRIAAILLTVLTKGEYPMPAIIDTVNIIRTAEDDIFYEWKQSPTARHFESHPYQNKKQSPAYFF